GLVDGIHPPVVEAEHGHRAVALEGDRHGARLARIIGAPRGSVGGLGALSGTLARGRPGGKPPRREPFSPPRPHHGSCRPPDRPAGACRAGATPARGPLAGPSGPPPAGRGPSAAARAAPGPLGSAGAAGAAR